MYTQNTIDFFTAANQFSNQQDTIKKKVNPVLGSDSIIQKKISNPNIPGLQKIQQIDFSALDSIMRKSEEREKQIQIEIQEQTQKDAAIQRWLRKQRDTTEILYKEFGIAGFPIKENLDNDQTQQNIFYNFLSIKPEEKQESNIVFVESKSNLNETVISQPEIKRNVPKEMPGRTQFDWVTILLIASIFLLGWVQLFNRKYLLSLIKSTISFQESATLYREKNSLMEKASFVLNFLFLSNISVFIIQIFHFYEVDILGLENYTLYFILLGIFFGLYIFRQATSLLIGFIFLKQKVYSEFFHNVNIYTKNTGLFLLPVIISLQFLMFEYLSFIAYTGFTVIAFLYLLHIVRSFQIIIRKNVSISYMILYLCAFEFAPFLILYKLALGLV